MVSPQKDEQNYRKSFNEIVSVNEQIISSIRVQKAYALTVLDKWESIVKEEVSIPSNRYLHWCGLVTPLLDSMVHTRLVEKEIEKKLFNYIEALKNYESNYILDYSVIEQLELTVDRMGEIIQKLETRLKAVGPSSDNIPLKWDTPLLPPKGVTKPTPTLIDTKNQYQEELEDEEPENGGIIIEEENSDKNTPSPPEGVTEPIPIQDDNEEEQETEIDFDKLKNIEKAQKIMKRLGMKY